MLISWTIIILSLYVYQIMLYILNMFFFYFKKENNVEEGTVENRHIENRRQREGGF